MNAPEVAPADEVVLVGAGRRARAWLEPLRLSRRLAAVATVTRGGTPLAADLPAYGSLDEALRTHPAAAFAVALPPRAGLAAALQLAAAGRRAVVEAPLDEGLLHAELGPGADAVRVAHGWVTLPGLRAVQAALRRSPAARLQVDVSGLPEEPHGDLEEALVHAAALVRALVPAAVPSAARYCEGGVEIELAEQSIGRGRTILLRVHTRGQRVAVDVAGGEAAVSWSWEPDREQVVLGGRPAVAPRATPPGPLRALAQLIPEATRGDGLHEAAGVLRLVRRCRSMLPTRWPLGARLFAQSLAIARRRPDDVLARLGLRGALPAEPGPAPGVSSIVLPAEPFELWAFRAGIKPVAFLTVRPEDVERTLAYFGDVSYERRERRVRVGAQDRWTDRRDEGEVHVELYIAADPALAQRAAHFQAEVDPTRALVELGTLVGYPPCCVEAFARQDDRANNSRNRYYTYARTLAPDGSTAAPWPWQLNNLDAMILPFYPCSYRCEAALAHARACLAELGRAHPDAIAELRAALARPVLYFDHDHQLVFAGDYRDGWVRYRSVVLARSASAQLIGLAAAIGRGDRLRFDHRELLVERDGTTVLRLARTDPALGFLAPFGTAEPEAVIG